MSLSGHLVPHAAFKGIPGGDLGTTHSAGGKECRGQKDCARDRYDTFCSFCKFFKGGKQNALSTVSAPEIIRWMWFRKIKKKVTNEFVLWYFL
jgi:hypothetical protein